MPSEVSASDKNRTKLCELFLLRSSRNTDRVGWLHSKAQRSSLVLPLVHSAPPCPHSQADGHLKAATCHSHPLSMSCTCSGVLRNASVWEPLSMPCICNDAPAGKVILSSGYDLLLIKQGGGGFQLGICGWPPSGLCVSDKMTLWGRWWKCFLKKWLETSKWCDDETHGYLQQIFSCQILRHRGASFKFEE